MHFILYLLILAVATLTGLYVKHHAEVKAEIAKLETDAKTDIAKVETDAKNDVCFTTEATKL